MEDRLETFTQKLQVEGYRLTESRLVIISTLLESEQHMSADSLVNIVKHRMPGIGRMTVYRTLDLLTILGLVRPVYQGTGAAHYVLLDEGHHHHLICSECNDVIEFDQCIIQELEQLVSSRYQFDIQGHLLEIYGRCQKCLH